MNASLSAGARLKQIDELLDQAMIIADEGGESFVAALLSQVHDAVAKRYVELSQTTPS